MSATTMHRRRYHGPDPTRRLVGWVVVIAIHVLVLWAVVTGTARRGLELIKKPLEAAVIQEVIIPPPPPPPPPPKEIKRPEQKVVKAEAPPPYVPPPEVQPPVSSSAVAVQSVATPPIAPPVIAPPPPPAPPKAAATGRAEMGVACPEQVKPEMPRKALQEGTEGVVRAQALIRDGTVREVTILSGPRVYHSAVRSAMLQYKCISGPGDVIATQEFVFKID
jgi:protein TonB